MSANEDSVGIKYEKGLKNTGYDTKSVQYWRTSNYLKNQVPVGLVGGADIFHGVGSVMHSATTKYLALFTVVLMPSFCDESNTSWVPTFQA